MKWSDKNFHWSLVVSTQPTIEPISVENLRTQARVNVNEEDDVLKDYIRAARMLVEKHAEVALVTQTLQLRMDAFPDWEIELRRCPVLAVSSVAYTDTAGASQTLSSADYVVDIYSRPARITPAYSTVWPSTYSQINAVTVTFTAGQGTNPMLIDEPAKQAIRMLAAHWSWAKEAYNTVPSEIEASYRALLDSISWAGYR